MRATKMLSSTRNLRYEERLKMLNLPTLKYRRIIGDNDRVVPDIEAIKPAPVGTTLT